MKNPTFVIAKSNTEFTPVSINHDGTVFYLSRHASTDDFLGEPRWHATHAHAADIVCDYTQALGDNIREARWDAVECTWDVIEVRDTYRGHRGEDFHADC